MHAADEAARMSTALQEIPVNRIDGTSTSLGERAGEVLLVVNVASQCGLTPQYAGLEALYRRYRDRGFAVLGFPANEFGAQEPGTNPEIAQFCETRFGVTFPMYEKIVVKGGAQHPLYAALTKAQAKAGVNAKTGSGGPKPGAQPDDIAWNFEKFVIGRGGEVVARLAPTVTPEDPELIAILEAQLAEE
jgi:glutathione peroxidase